MVTLPNIAEKEAYEYYRDLVNPLIEVRLIDPVLNLYKPYLNNVQVGHNDDIDAFRHAYVSGVYAMEFNSTTVSDILGVANELRGDYKGQPWIEKNMDLWNNADGRGVGINSSSKAEIANGVLGSLNNGSLITSLNDNRVYTGGFSFSGFYDDHSDYDLFLNVAGINQNGDAGYSITYGLSDDYLNGLALFGGNWSVNLPASILNGDGLLNVAPSSFLTDGFRPGAGELSIYTMSGFFGEEVAYDGLANAVFGVNDPFFTAALSGYGKINNYQGGSTSLQNIDPLILDLNNNGIELKSYQESNVLFNMDDDEYLEQTGWVKGTDGILVFDKNGDGVINDVSEMFSEYYAADVKNGLEALATLDSNNDNVFNSSDAAFSKVRVWQDANEDAQTDAGELKTLASLGITSISLNTTPGNGEVIEGNEVQRRSTMVKNGVTQQVAAINMLTNPAGHEWEVYSSGVELKSEAGVTSWTVTNPEGGTVVASAWEVQSIYGNVGSDYLIGDDGNNWLGGGAGADMLEGGDGDDVLLIDAEDPQYWINGGDGFDIVQVIGETGVNFNLTEAEVELAYGGEGDDILVGGGAASVFIGGGAGNDIIIGSGANDALSGNDGNDVIDGGYGDDVIRGHRGDDLLIGGFGNDILEGGDDNDVIDGGDGDDVIIANGGGVDEVDGGDGTDLLQLSGKFNEYTRTVLADGRIQLVDNVSGRDGTIKMKNMEFINFKGSNLNNVSVSLNNPLPANDNVTVGASGTQTILASTLLANDVDFQGDALTITSVSDAVGGTVSLNGSGDVLFTPTAGFTGVMSFKYKVKDSNNNAGLSVALQGDNQSAEMKGIVTVQTGNLPSDPLFSNQWYLSNINILPVWNDYTGKNIKVGVFEDHIFDYEHSDLNANVSSYHPNSVYTPEDIGSHTTLVAGIIAAERNNEGGIGVAYDAKISSHKISMDGFSDLANLINYDIANNSYNFSPAFILNPILYPSDQYITKTPATYGRDGLGTVLVWGAGNDRANGGDANTSDSNASRFSIEVGSVNNIGDLSTLQVGHTPFSCPGSSILVSAPGSNIVSTSQLYENEYGSSFGGDYETASGTSFATPIVSGIVALMLEANSNLGYRDVQKILAYSSTSISDPDTSWQYNDAKDWNGGGMHYSRDYGFGNVDALGAVRLAETWSTVQTASNEASSTKASATLNATIPDGTSSYTNTLNVADSLQVEHVEVVLNLNHAQLGDLVITLIAPDGTQSILLNRLEKAPGSSDAEDRGYGVINYPILLNSTNFWGENSVGNWQIKIEDKADNQVGTLNSWELRLYGSSASANNTYIYTNEFASAPGTSRATLTDTSGVDTINASAITSNSTINLTAGSTSNIAGRNLVISSGSTIENVYSGDGNDTITGNSSNNIISTGRGNDTVTGGGGADTFIIKKQNGASDIITDFSTTTSGEIIQLIGFNQSVAFANLNKVQSGSNVIITLEDGQTLTLQNVTLANLNASHFGSGGETLGTTGADNITGTSSGDIIKAKDGNDTIDGAAGDDNIDGGVGNDNLSGGIGNDTISGKEGDDAINGGDGNDSLYGGLDNDTIHGNNNDDQILGNLGDDNLYGDDGNDTLYGGGGLDSLYGGNGNDTIYGGHNSSTDITHDSVLIYGGAGNDTIYGTAADDVIYGEAGNDIINSGGGNDTIDGGTGLDTINGSSGDDIIHGGDDDDIIFAGDGDDIVYGDAGSDSLNGSDGDDIIHAGTGVMNHIWGENGSDRFVITQRYNADTDIIFDFDTSSQNERIDISAFGLTTAAYGSRIFFSSNVTYNIPDSNGVMQNYTGVTMFIRNTPGTITLPADMSNPNVQKVFLANVNINNLYNHHIVFTGNSETIFGTDNVDTITGSDGNDVVYGLDGADTLNGGAGKDELNGGSGDDALTGGYGDDTLNGGAGIDIAHYDFSEAININMQTGVFSGGEAVGDVFDEMEGVFGSIYNDTVTGYTLSANYLWGGDGNDNLTGGNLNDELHGNAGNDTVSGGDGDDWLTGNEGTDTVYGGSGNDNIEGNEDNDTLYGGAGNDVIDGGAGADIINGEVDTDRVTYINSTVAVIVNLETNVNTGGDAQGDSITNVEDISGSSYNDTITGNDNNNSINGNAGIDVIYGRNGADILNGNGGDDTLHGESGNDYLYGDEGNDSLNGGSGIDNLYGGDGDDLLNGGSEADVLDGGEGFDIAVYTYSGSAVTLSLQSNSGTAGEANGDTFVNIEAVSGSIYNDNITGNALDNTIWGNSGNDTVYGGDGNDTIYGQDGNDSLRGETGNDSIYGGNGNDILTGGLGADMLDGGAGQDRASYINATSAVTVNFLNVSLNTGEASGDIYTSIEDINGSIYNDVLTGDNNSNWIFDSAGDDAINGAGGNDFLSGDLGSDTIDGGSGTDKVFYSYSTSAVTANLVTNVNTGGYAQGDLLYNIEDVSGSAYNDSITGNSSNNSIWGNDGNDVLAGGAGADTIDGGAGIDRSDYTASAAAVIVNLVTNVNTGGDAQGDSLSNIEDVSGSAYNDTITGNSSSNSLWGGSGDDTIYGGAGVDTIYGDDGNDSLRGEDGDDIIYGGNGNDLLTGGLGTDALDGGAGSDRASYVSASSAVTVNFLNTSLNTGEAAGDTYTSIEEINGSIYNDNLTGDNNGNWIFGSYGDDIINGAGGNDGLDGGAGADTIDGGSGNDRSTYASSNAAVNINLATNTHSGGYATGDSLISIEDITGSAYDDVIVGSSVSNSLSGGNGNDTITGGGGADYIYGGSGADTFVFTSTSDSTTSSRDIIYDYADGSDKFSIHSSIATSFSSLSVTTSGGNTLVTDVDSSFNFQIIGTPTIDSSDFIFS